MPLRTRTETARRLRRDATDAEQLLWRALREAALPCKFRRQHPIGRRIVDFACPAHKLAIELDGGQHEARQEADAARSEELAWHGYRVIRFWNREVIDNPEGVILAICEALGSPTSPRPSPPQGGGEGDEAPAIIFRGRIRDHAR